jgi:hypothetical protein
MSLESDVSSLASLEFIPYIDAAGQLPEVLQGKVGVFGVFNQAQQLQYVAYSRDIFLTLQQLLVRQPHQCYWLKVQIIDRPNRTLLETIQAAWIAENGSVPEGNAVNQAQWTQPIAVQGEMTSDEQANYANALDEGAQAKVLKNVARRIEADILATLAARGLQLSLRFNPKLKESGLLDLK